MRAAGWAVTAVFFVNGATFANWVARVPAVKDAVDAGTGTLGLALLGVAAGSMVTLPFAGRLCDRFSSSRTVVVSGCGLAVTLFVVSLAPTVVTLALGLAFYGGAFGVLDVAMNVQAVAVVRGLGRPVMPLFHAAFSLGGLVGAGTGGLAAGVGLTPRSHFAVVGLVTAAVILGTRTRLLPDAAPAASAEEPAAGRPKRRLDRTVVGLGLVGCAAALCEGSMADWAALFLRDERGMAASAAALGFAAFSVTMTAGRLGGEAAIRRLGPVRVLRLGGLVGAAGVAAAVAFDPPLFAYAGFALIGLGVSCAFPLAINTAGEVAEGSAGDEIATISVIGYLGFLTGPPFIGLLAEAIGLRLALLAVVAPALALAALAPVVAPPDRRRTEIETPVAL